MANGSNNRNGDGRGGQNDCRRHYLYVRGAVDGQLAPWRITPASLFDNGGMADRLPGRRAEAIPPRLRDVRRGVVLRAGGPGNAASKSTRLPIWKVLPSPRRPSTFAS